jgi:hypothetical protein
MPRRSWILPLALLAASILACGLPAGGQGIPSGTGEAPAPAPAEPASAPAPEPLPPSDFAEVLDAEVAAGEITYEQGLIRLLRSFLGEEGVTLPLAYSGVVTTEGNSIVERAGEYIAEGPDEAARVEMARLLDVLFPGPEKLEAYSRPATSSLGSPGLARPPAQIDCVGLYRAGFPLDGVTTYPCFEYVSGSVGAVGSYTIYYPAIWYEGHPDREWLEPASAAALASMESLGRYGLIGPVNIIFSLSPGRSASILAQVSAYHPGATDVCPILIFPSALTLGQAEFQQSIAHEMFHCYQLRNFRTQLLGVDQAYKQWWSEGTAEYFSNVVYPGVNYEHRWIPTFDGRSPSMPLIGMGYETFGFFQYVAGNAGDTAVLGLIGAMPTSGGLPEQERALAGLSSIEETFHEFGRAYLDGRIADSGGGTVPFTFDRGPVHNVPQEVWIQNFGVGPFVLQRFLLNFAEDTRFSIVAELAGAPGRYAAQRNGEPGVWGTLPERLNTACEEPGHQVLFTTTNPDGSSAELELEAIGEALPPDTTCDCLVGTWTLDNATFLPWADTLLSQGTAGAGINAQATGVSGEMTLVFTPEGLAEGSQSAWTLSGTGSVGGQTTQVQMSWNGGGTASWRSETVPDTDDKFVVFDDSEFDLSAEGVWSSGGIVLAQIPRTAMSDTNVSFFLSGSHPYTCTDTTLTMYGGDLPPVTFTRGVGEATAP